MIKTLSIYISIILGTSGVVWGAAIYFTNQQHVNKDYSHQLEQISAEIGSVKTLVLKQENNIDSLKDNDKEQSRMTRKNNVAIERLYEKTATKDDLIEFYRIMNGDEKKK